MIIDTHAHYVPASFIEDARALDALTIIAIRETNAAKLFGIN
jgi:hypothetical protein